MTKPLWNITYEIITEESAEDGEAESQGFHYEDTDFRTAIEAFPWEGCQVEADCYPVTSPRWFTAYKTNDGTRSFYEDGETENQSLHIPEHITEASRQRIARLIGCYGTSPR